METKLLDPRTDADALKQAAALIRAGEVVGLPTETVYGLGADATNSAAVRKIFLAKGRPQDNPLIVHIADFDQLDRLTPQRRPEVKRLAANFWPGPLTVVLRRTGIIPPETAAGLETVGIRLPSHPMMREIIRLAGVPVAAPSANLSGRPSTTTAAHVLHDMDGRISAVVDGGACAVGVESTVLSLVDDEPPRLLRPGGVTLEQLRAVLGEVEVDRALREQIGEDARVSAPGMKYQHYAPRAPVTVVQGAPAATAAYIRDHAGAGTGILCFDEFTTSFPVGIVQTFGPMLDVRAQARLVFDRLRAFDETEAVEIYAQCPPDAGMGLAVANRIQKAAGFRVVQAE